ncbi:hypothetical protein ES708_34518 [subsurface metagenome]
MMVPNKLWEALYKIELPCQHRRVWDYIYRETKGWGIDFKEISTYEIAKELGLPGSSVRRIKRALFKMKMLVEKGNLIGIQEDFRLWEVGPGGPIKKVGPGGPNNRTLKVHLVGPGGPLIERQVKDKRHRQEDFYIKLSRKEIEKLESDQWYRAVMWNYGKFGMDYIEKTIKDYDYDTRMSCWYIYEDSGNIRKSILALRIL